MIFIVDGNNLAFASNMITRLHTKDNFPTQAIKGFFNFLHCYARDFGPKKIFVVWDGGKSKRRLELCPEYKANRMKEKTPQEKMAWEEFQMQVPLIKKALFDLGVYNCIGGGVEGDDIAAMLALSAERAGEQAIIFSSDADFFQLVSPLVSVHSVLTKKKERHVTIWNMEELCGLQPTQWLEYKALLGDKSDNISGVPGVGEKTAMQVLKTFGSIEAFVDDQNSDKPTAAGKREKAILDHLGLIERNKKMMDLRNPTCTFASIKLLNKAPDYPALRAFFGKMEMSSFYLQFNSWISAFNTMRKMEV